MNIYDFPLRKLLVYQQVALQILMLHHALSWFIITFRSKKSYSNYNRNYRMGPQDGPQKKISVSQQFYGLWRFMLDMSYKKNLMNTSYII